MHISRAPTLYRNFRASPARTRIAALQMTPRYAGRFGLGYLAGPGCNCNSGSQPLGTLGMSFLTKVLRSATPGPNAFKLKSTPKEIKKVIAVAGPALSAIPGWGTLAAAGATVITVGDQRLKAKRLASTSGGASLLEEYSTMAGTVPGRIFGLDNMTKVIDAIGLSGGWPNVKKWQGGVVNQVLTTGCKGCTPPTMKEWVATKLSQGQDNPISLANEWTNWVNQSWGSKWFVASAGEVQRQAIIDTLDALIAEAKPNAPLYYAVGGPDPATVTPTPTPVPVPGPGTIPTPTPNPVPVPTPGPGTVPLPGPAITSATDPALQTYIQALLNQGATQQQAFSAALAALGNSGQAITPQVQAQVADTVQSSGSMFGSIPPWGIALGAVVVIGAGVMIARKKRR